MKEEHTLKRWLNIMIRKISILFVAFLLGNMAFAQSDHEVDSTFLRTQFDADSLYYDEWAYLDDYHFFDNIFVLGQLGISHSMSENTRFGNFFANQKLSFNIGIGKWLYPSFGLRLTAGVHPQVGRAEWELAELLDNGWRLAEGSKYPFGNYNFSIISAYLDGLVNLTNIILKYKEDRLFNLIGIIGLGYDRSFGFEKEKLAEWSSGVTYAREGIERTFTYQVSSNPGNYFAFHIGLQGRWKASPAWDLIAEVTFNGTDDDYNGIAYDRVYDTYFDILVGAQFHFKDCHGRRRFHYVKHLNEAVMARLNKMASDENERLAEANAAIPEIFEKIKLSEALQTTISFYVDRYYITDAQKKNVKSVATFLQTHPDINLIVTGYADIETAYPAYNLRLSQKRAQAVYDMLVNEFHVPTNRLRIDYKGDTVQPYTSVNEWNRAVIFFLDRDGGKSQLLKSEE